MFLPRPSFTDEIPNRLPSNRLAFPTFSRDLACHTKTQEKSLEEKLLIPVQASA